VATYVYKPEPGTSAPTLSNSRSSPTQTCEPRCSPAYDSVQRARIALDGAKQGGKRQSETLALNVADPHATGSISDQSSTALPARRSHRCASGTIPAAIVWAALDCPSWFGILAFGRGAQYALLGELAVHVLDRPREGERCVVTGWSRGHDGRKLYGGTALHGATGRLLASSAATWIELKSAHTLR
jgi:hypothetical protein